MRGCGRKWEVDPKNCGRWEVGPTKQVGGGKTPQLIVIAVLWEHRPNDSPLNVALGGQTQ